MQDFWQQLESDSTSWQKTLKSSHNSQNQWHVVSTLCQEMNNQLTRKVGFKGTPKLDPYWKSQPVTCKVNTEWKSEFNLWTKTIPTRGSEFLTAWTSWSQTCRQQGERQQRAGNLWDAVRRICVVDECICFCEPIKGQSKTTETYFYLLIYKNCTYLWKIFGLILSQNLIRLSLTQCQNNWVLFFVSGRWSDRILETEKWSSEQIWALSTLVWWNVEK